MDIGQDWSGWITYFVAWALIAVGFFGALSAIKSYLSFDMAKMATSGDSRAVWQIKGDRYRFKAILCALILAVAIPGYFVFYGPGESAQSPPAEEGASIKMNREAPDLDPPEVIKKRAYESKPDELKKQYQNADEERREADDYIRKALEKAKENQ